MKHKLLSILLCLAMALSFVLCVAVSRAAAALRLRAAARNDGFYGPEKAE